MLARLKVISYWLLVHGKKQIQETVNREAQAKRTHNQLGFTLIELMITITIIAIISAVGVVSYSQAQKIARDARRKQDLRTIATALEIYYLKNKRYPINNCQSVSVSVSVSGYGNWRTLANTGGEAFWINDSAGPGCTGTATAIPLDQNYINQMPLEPLGKENNPVNGAMGYSYGTLPNLTGGTCPSPLEGNYYVLTTTLENADDPEADSKIHYKYCNGVLDIFTDKNPNGYAITSP